MTSRQGSAKDAAVAEQQQQRDGDFEPVYEWLDTGALYLLRLNVPEFKKEDFQVHVDPAGRLTVRGQHGNLWLNKVFQLPPMCNLDGITGRLEASVLVLTVPKLPATSAATTAALPPKAKEEEKETKKADEDVAGKAPPTDHKAKTDSDQAERTTQAARERPAAGRHGQEKKEEEPKAAAPAAPPPQPARREPAAREHHDDDEKARAEHKARLSREADQRIEAARARLVAQQAPRPATAPAPEKKAPCWKERAAEEGLKLAEAIGKNREVVATAVAAFALGVFVSSKLFSRNN